MPLSAQRSVQFKHNATSRFSVKQFLQRHNLHYSSVRAFQGTQLDVVSKEHVTTHLSSVRVMMKRYHIRESYLLFNLDQTGQSFKCYGREQFKERNRSVG